MTGHIVGLLVGRENTFPGPFIETVNRKGEAKGVRAEMVTFGGATELEEPRYRVIVDRISHEVPYYRTGTSTFGQRPKTMILQEFIHWDDYIRCICIGRKHINPIRYDPNAPFHERYVIDRPIEGAVRERAIHDAQMLTDALGYDMDTVEFAVRDGILYAI